MKGRHTVQTGKEVRSMFPEQTKSIPAILLWLVVFALDLVLVFWLAGKLGIDLMVMNYHLRGAMVMLYVGAAGGLFWGEASIYNRIVSLFR